MSAFNVTGFIDSGSGLLDSSIDSTGDKKIILLGRANFNSGVLPPPTIVGGNTWAVGNGSPFIEDGALRMNYPYRDFGAGGIVNSLHFDVPDGIKELYVRFRAKMPNAKHGLKFLKVFGRNATGGANTVANTTFALDYTGANNGSMLMVGFGDGSTQSNDTQNVMKLNGADPNQLGRAFGVGANVVSAGNFFLSSEWGTEWHTFRFKIKFNDGTTEENEINNGEILVNIDGVDYAHATGLFNRHYTNGDIHYLSFGDWSQGSVGGSPAFEIYYDDIFISRNGFYEGV
jgi:hypothetical protein